MSALREKSSMQRHSRSLSVGLLCDPDPRLDGVPSAVDGPGADQSRRARPWRRRNGVEGRARIRRGESRSDGSEADAGHLDLGGLRLGPLGPRDDSPGNRCWRPFTQREAHLEHVLLETERARNESESLMADHRKVMATSERRGAGDFGQSANRGPGGSRLDCQASSERSRPGTAAGTARHRIGARPGPCRDLAKDRRHGRLGCRDACSPSS